MKYIDEFRDPRKARALVERIGECVQKLPQTKERPLQIMEFCGGHTHTIFRYGIEHMLPPQIELVHGPGCPVCVLPRERVDDCVALAERPDVILATFGDAMRVPGTDKSLLEARAEGADIRMVYSPLDALDLARRHPDRHVIFFALGFETTMPGTALTVLQAAHEGVENFSLFCNHITTVPIVKSVLDAPDMQLDALIAPGHVGMVVGEEPFQGLAQNYATPIVITGFEPLDILQSLWMLIKQLAEGRCEVQNQYARVVHKNGNPPGLAAMHKVFEIREASQWRGLGAIDHSGVKIRDAYAGFDAEHRFALRMQNRDEPQSCQCGEVLRGAIRPWACPAFGTGCTPESPQGALMVSSEGACAAYYKYGHLPDLLAKRTHNENKAASV